MSYDWRKAKAIENEYKKQLLVLNNKLNDKSGIYFLTRVDENGMKFGYVGQAKKVLSRLCSHMVGRQQHIDLSLLKHKLYSEDNPYGWKVDFINCDESELDELEQKYILEYANQGFQLRNKTSGSQGVGKQQIDEYKPRKGYNDGKKEGKRQLAKELSAIIDKHLIISLKKESKVSQKQLEKFYELINEETYK